MGNAMDVNNTIEFDLRSMPDVLQPHLLKIKANSLLPIIEADVKKLRPGNFILSWTTPDSEQCCKVNMMFNSDIDRVEWQLRWM